MKQLSFKTRLLNTFRLLLRNRPAERWLSKLTKGKSADAFWARIPANYYQYPAGSIRKVNRHGFDFELDLSDYMQWVIFFEIEAEPRHILYDLVKTGMTVADIGANIGETTLEFSRRTGPNGKVFSFEPDPITFQRIEHHVAINNCTNVQLINAGIGNSEGIFHLSATEGNRGGHHISEASESSREIRVTTLDKWAASENISSLGFIKIDIEGYEWHALSGGSATIQRFRPVIFAEVNDELLQRQSQSTRTLLALLESWNYQLVYAATDQPVKSTDSHFEKHFDIIARPA